MVYFKLDLYFPGVGGAGNYQNLRLTQFGLTSLLALSLARTDEEGGEEFEKGEKDEDSTYCLYSGFPLTYPLSYYVREKSPLRIRG